MLVVVDTNVWVSALINKRGYPAKLLDAYIKDYFLLVISEQMLCELSDVLSRPRIKTKYNITSNDIIELLTLIRYKAKIVPITNNIKISRDIDDNLIIETALNGKADIIISRDEDIIRDIKVIDYLSKVGIKVTTVQHFLDEIKQIYP